MSFSTLVARIATLTVLANQQSRSLDCATETDSLLNYDMNMFPCIVNAGSTVETGLEKLDGCYLFEDSKRKHLIRSGTTIAGFRNRFKAHERKSRDPDRALYHKYPHDTIVGDGTAMKVGTWSQLIQRMALGVKKGDRARLQALLPLHELDLVHLDKLKLPGGVGTSGDKYYKHLCFMFETFYALCIRPSDNTTENPGCEWQLGLYSQKS